ncbi:Crp/Fnr family transcriptional regulator [Patescibacteria group bacterium]
MMDKSSAFTKLDKFLKTFTSRSYQKNQVLINAQEEPRGIFYLEKGYVRLYAISPEGKELTLNIFKPGSLFPLTWAIGRRPNGYFFEAMTIIKVKLVPKNIFLNFLEDQPGILRHFTERILIGLDGFLTRTEYLLFGNAAQRVSSVLVMMAKRFGQKNKDDLVEINLPLTHQSIADLAGLTRESTSLEIKKLERKNLIFSSRKIITIKDLGKVKEICLLCRDEESLPDSF